MEQERQQILLYGLVLVQVILYQPIIKTGLLQMSGSIVLMGVQRGIMLLQTIE